MSSTKDARADIRNLYVHFPFCRNKCSYCALYSRARVTADEREAYVLERCRELDGLGPFSTVYFGGGTPALCDLKPLFNVLNLAKGAEFSVELHPLDATEQTLATLRDGGVTRVSMGVESLDDATLMRMGRGYTVREAEAAFQRVRRVFPHAGIDLIVGYPQDPCENLDCLASWDLSHISVYALQNERGLKNVPSDDIVLDRLARTADVLASLGLERYEISNYARPGEECRHNLAVWRGEDYIGLGEGACGREGLTRTRGRRGRPEEGRRVVYDRETLSPERDDIERRIFRLRTREGLDIDGHPEWEEALRPSLDEGLLTRAGNIYRLTPRGMEVCDAILSSLVLA